MMQRPAAGATSVDSVAASHGQGASVSSVRLRVQGAGGRVQSIDVPAPNEAEAVRYAVARGLTVLAIESGAVLSGTGSGKEVRFPLILFSQELLALLEAGLNLTEALATLLAKERHPGIKGILQYVTDALAQGRNFSDVLAMHPKCFPDVYVATIRASEKTGDLGNALARYIAYQIQFETIRKKLVSVSIYPVILLAVGGLVTLFLLGYVVPRFSTVYASSGREIPWMSAMLLQVGQVIYQHWQVVLMVFIGCGVVLGWGVSRPAGRRWLVDQVLRLPFLSVKSEEFRLARFYRAVSLLLASGIPLPRALGMVTGLLSVPQQAALSKVRLMVEEGRSLSAALQAQSLASPVAESLIKVGERSGQLADMLERTARFHDDDFARWVDWASKLIEPMLMTLIGIVIGGVVVLMYMPVFELAGSLQ